MSAFKKTRPVLVGVWLLLLSDVSAAGLSYQQALQLAERDAPQNQAREAQLASAQAAVEPADALPDPQLLFGLENVPIEGSDRYSLNSEPMTMRRIGLAQEIPNGDKRAARRAFAEASVQVATAEQQVTRLESRREAALGWLQLYYSERSEQLLDQLDSEISLLRRSVQALVAGGSVQPVDLLEADQEALLLAERREQLQRDIRMARASLARWIGPAASQPLSGPPPPLTPLQPAALNLHPHLNATAARINEANAELAEAVADKQPDWGVALGYSNRDPRFGDMVSLQFSVDLPILVGSRQGPRIRAQQHQVERLEAEQQAYTRQLQAQLDSQLAERTQLEKSVQRLQQALIPLAQQRAELQLAAYQAGQTELSNLIAARRDLLEAQLRELDQQRLLSQLSASLYFDYVEGLQ